MNDGPKTDWRSLLWVEVAAIDGEQVVSPADALDWHRQEFLRVLSAFLYDQTIPRADRQDEAQATYAVVRQIAAIAGFVVK